MRLRGHTKQNRRPLVLGRTGQRHELPDKSGSATMDEIGCLDYTYFGMNSEEHGSNVFPTVETVASPSWTRHLGIGLLGLRFFFPSIAIETSGGIRNDREHHEMVDSRKEHGWKWNSFGGKGGFTCGKAKHSVSVYFIGILFPFLK